MAKKKILQEDIQIHVEAQPCDNLCCLNILIQGPGTEPLSNDAILGVLEGLCKVIRDKTPLQRPAAMAEANTHLH